MSDYCRLKHEIEEIGQHMIGCPKLCSGNEIELDLKAGIPPRGLYFEFEDRSGQLGVIVVGINPGSIAPNPTKKTERKIIKQERDFYTRYNNTYLAMTEEWKKSKFGKHYYDPLRWLVNEFEDINGPILWTDLVKCESKSKKTLRLQTIRICLANFLAREIGAVPNNWPIIAVGKEAYTALAYRFPDRAVAGIPHVSGAYGAPLAALKDERGYLKCCIKKAFIGICRERSTGWLPHSLEDEGN
jgi:hypothetical protein